MAENLAAEQNKPGYSMASSLMLFFVSAVIAGAVAISL
jgi:hypothetical protein